MFKHLPTVLRLRSVFRSIALENTLMLSDIFKAEFLSQSVRFTFYVLMFQHNFNVWTVIPIQSIQNKITHIHTAGCSKNYAHFVDIQYSTPHVLTCVTLWLFKSYDVCKMEGNLLNVQWHSFWDVKKKQFQVT